MLLVSLCLWVLLGVVVASSLAFPLVRFSVMERELLPSFGVLVTAGVKGFFALLLLLVGPGILDVAPPLAGVRPLSRGSVVSLPVLERDRILYRGRLLAAFVIFLLDLGISLRSSFLDVQESAEEASLTVEAELPSSLVPSSVFCVANVKSGVGTGGGTQPLVF